MPAARPVGVLETRSWCLLAAAVLVTTAYPGRSLDQWLPELAPAPRAHLAAELGRFIARLHQLGFRDRNLDLRNLLARQRADGSFEVTKIDSGRFRLVRPGPATDRLARADWARLRPQLDAFGIEAAARAAADAASRPPT